MKRLGSILGFVVALAVGAVQSARAEDAGIVLRAADPVPASVLSVQSSSSLSVGYQGPTLGAWSLATPVIGRSAVGGLGVSSLQDVSARYSTHLFGGDVGVFGGYADQPTFLSMAPRTAWSFGATVGYAGVYLLGGVNDTPGFGPFLGSEGWAAGLGYEMGAFDLRLTYAANAGALAVVHENPESQQIMLGGIYRLSPRVRLNADAFYGGGQHGALSLIAPSIKSPQGTGARVGVELRF